MKLSQLKNIIKEELKRLGPLQKEDLAGGCSGTCTVTVERDTGNKTYRGVCAPRLLGTHCQCKAGPHLIDCDDGPGRVATDDRRQTIQRPQRP
jgi:hypothetical protein